MSGPLRIGVSCFSGWGGSAVVAAEVASAMAARGHHVHVVARELPVRLLAAAGGVVFHPVRESDYPALADSSAFVVALASKLVDVAVRERLDVLHAHYAVPHATAAWMAREILGPTGPRVVTTLHGTDVTVVGGDPGHLPVVRHSIVKSDAVTTPSEALRVAARARFALDPAFPIDVVPNFVDAARFAPSADRAPLRRLFAGRGEELRDDDPVLFHVSNFRPVKRVLDVVHVFAEVAQRTRARLVLVGDGPDRSAAEWKVGDLGLAARTAFVGKQEHFELLLAASTVFLLPSETESFGLAALEAQSCGVPVVASNAGGVAEVIEHGVTGLLAQVGDVAQLTAHTLSLIDDEPRRRALSAAARARVLARFAAGPAIDAYESIYRRVIAR